MLYGGFVTFFALYHLAACNPAAQDCDKLLRSAGASPKFFGSVAHGIHSMTVSELKKFYPNATEVNYVPTINKDLSSDQAILLHAPDTISSMDQSLFDTDGMKTLDAILLHMDNKFWDVKNFSPLERVVHEFHMKEVWAKTLKQFQKIKKSNQPNANACDCAMNIGNNGIMNVLKYLALVIREPSLVQGNPSYKSFDWRNNIYNYNNFAVETVNQTVDYVREAKKDPMPRLTDANSWKVWRTQLPPNEQNYDLALYLYCAAKKSNGI